MATVDQLTQEQDIQPLRPTTLSYSQQKTQALQGLHLQDKFTREVGAPEEFRVSGAPYVVDRKREKDEYELRKLQWLRMNM